MMRTGHPGRPSLLRRLRSVIVLHGMRVFEALLLMQSGARSGGGVAIVRLDAIGDFVLWLDAAKEFRQLYPGKRITLLANSIWAELAARLPYWDEVWPVDVPRLRKYSGYRWHLLRALRMRGFDIALQPVLSRVYLEGDALIRASGAGERIGSAGDDSRIQPHQKRVSDRWYTRLIAARPQPVQELERNAEFMRALGRAEFAAAGPLLPKLCELPQRLRIAVPYLIVFPGASWIEKRWPVSRFAQIADHFSREMGLKVVVCGSRDETGLCQVVARTATVEVANLAGQTTLSEFVELVRGARLLIGNDTAAVHFAAAVKTPAICILGGGHYGRFLPYGARVDGDTAPLVVAHRMPCYGCNWQCTQPHVKGEPVPCIRNISVQDVLRASDMAISGAGLRAS